MAEIKLTINGKTVSGESGDTVLDVCSKNDIYVPTLCHFEGLKDIGACRVCIVDIQGPGRPKISTACTTPAVDEMVVEVDTDDLHSMRKNIVELMLSKGYHHCLYCVASGDCDLQDMAYELGIDHIRIPIADPVDQINVDSSHRYLVSDPNRCILCYRCVRACAELSGNNTLAIGERGSKANIIADLNQARGESTCVDCGSCIQVCPTGALSERRSSYMGRETQIDRTQSTCLFCSVGCANEILVRDNYIVSVEGDWDGVPNKGLLCKLGRFAPLYDEDRKRAVKPMIKRNGSLEDADWNDALNLVADKMKSFGVGNIGTLVSTQATNEAMKLIANYSKGNGVYNIASLSGKLTGNPEDKSNLTALSKMDAIIVVGEDLAEDHQVVGFLVKRALMEQESQLIIIDDKENGMAELADLCLKPDQVGEAISQCNSAEKVAVVYGERAGAELDALRKEFGEKASFYWMAPGVNSLGALAAGLGKNFSAAKCVYILACNDEGPSSDLMEKLGKADFVAVQTSYMEPWSEFADVILPSVNWAEKDGTITNLEGRNLELKAAVEPPKGVKGEIEILEALANKLG